MSTSACDRSAGAGRGLRQGDLVRLLAQLHQHLAGLHRLVFMHRNLNHLARHFRADHDHGGLDVGIVSARVALAAQIEISAADSDHDSAERKQWPAQAATQIGWFGRGWGRGVSGVVHGVERV
jgi:hypothetical protein